MAAIMFILGILKIIGIVLLVLLGILLTLVLLVLLAPVCYSIEGSYYGTVKAVARVSWLFPILSARAVYEEKMNLAVRILGIRVFQEEMAFGKDGEEEEKEANQETDQASKEDKKAPRISGEKPEEETTKETTEKRLEIPKDKKIKKEQIKKEQIKEERIKPEKEPQEKESLKDKAKGKRKEKPKRAQKHKTDSWIERWKTKVQEIKKSLNNLKKKKDKIWRFLCNEKNQRTFRLLLRQLKALVRHILPKKVSGEVRFGFDDPYTTGQILTYISPFYGLYADHLKVIPVFGESVMEGEGRIKGRIRIGTLIVIVVRMLFDKNFRTLLKKCLKS